MYLSSNKYPEFAEKDADFKRECVKFCAEKAGLGRRFMMVIVTLLLFIVLWSFWLEALIFGKLSAPYGLLVPVIIGGVFWIYLIYEINTSMHKAVKQYIAEFEHSKKGQGDA